MEYGIKFGIIAICYLIVLTSRNNYVSKADFRLCLAAFTFTLLADFFLIFNINHTLGVGIFVFAQGFYFWRHLRLLANKLQALGIVLIAVNIILVVLFRAEKMVLAGIYGANLLLSVSTALLVYFKKASPIPNRLFIAGGMVLFLLCDINVGLFNFLSGDIAKICYNLIWIFYIPSQILLCLSPKDWDIVWEQRGK